MSVEERKKIEEMFPYVGFTATFLMTLLCGAYDGWNLPTMLTAIALGSRLNHRDKSRINGLENKIAEIKDDRGEYHGL